MAVSSFLQKTERFAARFVHISATVIFVVLSVTSLLFTRYFISYDSETPYNKLDFFPVALFGAAVIALFSVFLGKAVVKNEDAAMRRLRLLLAAVLLWTAAAGIFWVLGAKTGYSYDQRFVYTSAQYFLEGDFHRFDYSKYLYYYPSQLGLAAYESLILKFAGIDNYTAIKLVNVFWAVLCVYSGYRVTRLLSENLKAAAVYLVLMAGCFPLIIYCSFLYGDIPAASLCMAAIWQLLRFLKSGKKSGAFLFLLFIAAACIIRQNSLIVMIAAFCVLAVKALADKRAVLAAMAALTLLVSLGGGELLDGCYEHVSGKVVNDGVPAILWVAMGMRDGDKEAGWYDGFALNTYIYADYDSAAASSEGIAEIKSRLEGFFDDPLYAADFYFRKFTSQWNEPTYECLWMTYETADGEERSAFMESLYTGFPKKLLDNFLDSYQLLLYMSVLAALIMGFRRGRPLEWYLPLICVIGGVLFHLIWEAKSRYILPYFIIMIPIAAEGLSRSASWLQKQLTRKGLFLRRNP